MNKNKFSRLEKLSVANQRRLDELLEKNRERTIVAAERTELEALVVEAEKLMAANAVRLLTSPDSA